jgi:probable HAF family extracellular repeat protein
MEVALRRSSIVRFAPVILSLIVSGSPLLAQDQAPPDLDIRNHFRFMVTDLGSLRGAPFSMAVGLNDVGTVAGASLLPDESAQHAVLWHRGQIADIGAPGLGGPNSAVYAVNLRGQASGAGEIATVDPNGEDFCGYGTHLICRAFVWKDGEATALPTLGGNNAEAGEINDRGVVAGNAENATVDSTCPSPKVQVLQEKPVVWENGAIRELPTPSGDPDGWTFGINDRDQVVGASGVCATINEDTGVYILSRHALLWDQGRVVQLEGLGGAGKIGPGNVGLEINKWGQVAGASTLRGDTNFHATLWDGRRTPHDLNVLEGDANSAGLGINDRGEVVGVSFDSNGDPRAFLFHDGQMNDLNSLVPADSPLYLLFAHGINSLGEIAGFGVDSTGNVHAFLATPCDLLNEGTRKCNDYADDSSAESNSATRKPKLVMSENSRKLLQRRLRLHLFPD